MSVEIRDRGNALLLERRAHQLAGRALVPSALDENLQQSPFIIDGALQVQQPPADPDHHLIQVPRGLGFGLRIRAMAGPDFKTQCRSVS